MGRTVKSGSFANKRQLQRCAECGTSRVCLIWAFQSLTVAARDVPLVSGAIRIAVVCLSMLVPAYLAAAPVSSEDARRAVQNWLKDDVQGFGLSKGVESAASYDVGSNEIHVVELEGAGFVITSGDDEIEPILAFSDSGRFELDKNSPLWGLLDADMKRRAAAVSGSKAQPKMLFASSSSAAGDSAVKAKQKWRKLLGSKPLLAASNGISTSSITDVRQSPLVKTQWGQTKVAGGFLDLGKVHCYNYFTPKNYPCGCVATAMAQVMKYHAWPQGEVEPRTVECSCEGESLPYRCTMKGGVYNWAKMPNDPDGAGQDVRGYIGKLTYDCGVAVGMQYASGGSGIPTEKMPVVATALKDVFGYACANSCSGYDEAALEANLNAKCPVILAIAGGSSGHAIVADGYGYSGDETKYFHLNMGWDGTGNLWYNLESDISAEGNTYSVITGMIYNVFPQESGGIISGRVLAESGAYIEGATVSVFDEEGTEVGVTEMDNRGIYAFILPPGRYSLRASMIDENGHLFENDYFWNSWGVDVYSDEDAFCDCDITITPIALGADIADDYLAFSTGTGAPWGYDLIEDAKNGNAARSAKIASKGESWVELPVEGRGKLVFNWKVSSEPDYDFLHFSVNGDEVASISGTNSSWQTVAYYATNTVADYVWTEEENVFRWSYKKDQAVDCGLDCGWLDAVEWRPEITERFSTSDYSASPYYSYYSSRKCFVGEPALPPPVPNRPGYAFGGWYKTAWKTGEGRSVCVTNWYRVGMLIESDDQYSKYSTWNGCWVKVSKPGTLDVPSDWLANYGLLRDGYQDYAQNLPTKTVGGRPFYAWQDYVAGTNPTNTESVFKATVSIVDGKPVVDWDPKLTPEEAAKRTYTVYGCSELGGKWYNADEASAEVKSQLRFFKVGVEMK